MQTPSCILGLGDSRVGGWKSRGGNSWWVWWTHDGGVSRLTLLRGGGSSLRFESITEWLSHGEGGTHDGGRWKANRGVWKLERLSRGITATSDHDITHTTMGVLMTCAGCIPFSLSTKVQMSKLCTCSFRPGIPCDCVVQNPVLLFFLLSVSWFWPLLLFLSQAFLPQPDVSGHFHEITPRDSKKKKWKDKIRKSRHRVGCLYRQKQFTLRCSSPSRKLCASKLLEKLRDSIIGTRKQRVIKHIQLLRKLKIFLFHWQLVFLKIRIGL